MSSRNGGRRPGAGLVALIVVLCVGGGIFVWLRGRGEDGPSETAPAAARKRAPTLRQGAPTESAPGGRIEGRVLDPDGAPVPGAAVTAIRRRDLDEPPPRSGLLPLATRSGPDGAFALEGLSPGRYTVAAIAAPFTGAFASGVELGPRQRVSGVELRLRRDGVVVSGRVLDEGGGPIPGATVRTIHWPSAGRRDPQAESAGFETRADGQGAYRLGLPKGRHFVVASADGYTSTGEMLDVDAATTKDLRLEPAARIAGRVLGEDGTAVAGAEVIAESIDRPFDNPVEPTTSDEEGRFRFGSLPGGSHRLSARKGPLVGIRPQPVLATVTAPVEDVELRLLRGASLEGTVKSSAGKPIVGARVNLLPERNGTPMGRAGSPDVRSDEAGRYRVEGLQPGSYRASLLAEGFARASDDVAIQGETRRDFVLQDGVVVSGLVLTAAGQPAAGAEIEARARPRERNAMGGGQSVTTDAEGRFELKRLVPGDVTLTVRHRQEATTHGPELVAPGERKQLTIKLAPGARVSGTITWDDGQPAAGIKILGTLRGGGASQAEATSGTDGRFTLAPFAPGRVSVVAMPPGERTSWSSAPRPEQADLQLTAGEHKQGVKLVASRRDGVIKGLVVGPDGRPVDGASVRAGAERDGRAYPGSPGEGRGTSNPDGAFSIEALKRGSYTLWFSHPSFADGERTGVAAGTRDVRLQLTAGGRIAGVLLDGAGRPVSIYALSLLQVRPNEPEQRRLSRLSGSTTVRVDVRDPAGAFVAERVVAGAYELVATTPDGAVARTKVTVGAGERKEGLRLVTEAGGTITGRVVEYESGQPLAGVRARVRLPGGAERDATTDGTGAFTMDGVPALPGLAVRLDPPQRAQVSETVPLPPATGARTELGTIKLLRVDPNNPNRGRFGINYIERDGTIVIGDVLADSIAAKLGIQKGDVILAVEGKKPTDMMEISRFLRGDPDKVVTVTLQTPGQPPRDVKMKRAM